jgi:hypothetical protein
MAADVRVILSGDDQWTVALDGRNVVGFFGPRARFLAERHRDELAELLGAEAARQPASLMMPRDYPAVAVDSVARCCLMKA